MPRDAVTIPEAINRIEAKRAEQWRMRREAEGSRDAARAACDSMRIERDDAVTELARMKSALKLIAEGYLVQVRDDRYVVIENPDFQPDNGSDPFIVIDTKDGLE